MTTQNFTLHSTRVVTPQGLKEAWINISDDKISSVMTEPPKNHAVTSVGAAVIMPGLVDSHVHINEPGRTEWEGFFTATQAAIAGGVTTVVDMPLNCMPVTTTVQALQEKLAALGDQLHVDIGFWGGVVPEHTDELKALASAGVLGAKAFMCHSGIDDFPDSDRETLRRAMAILKEAGIPLLLHAELESEIELHHADHTSYQSYLESRPASWEIEAIRVAIELIRDTGCATHIVHLSAAEALPMIEAAKAEGLPLTVETCPHYLCLTAEEIAHKQTQFKCAPPIREADNREKLWEGLMSGVIDFIVSDHSPCTPQLKKLDSGDFHDAWGGISSLQLGLPNVWTEAKKRGINFERLTEWLCTRPAYFAGLSHCKGKIEAGYDADLVIWEPDEAFLLEPADLRFKHKLSPYLGRTLSGRVSHTYLRGRLAYHDGEILAASGQAILGRSAQILDRLLALSHEERIEAVHRCCGSMRWAKSFAEDMIALKNDQSLFTLADELWLQMDEADILEAFSHHPQIGADPAQLRARFKNTHTWSAKEQEGMSEASDEVIERLAQGNRDYLSKFGYIFIVCATGKSAQEMLNLLEARLPNDPSVELQIAAAEQAKITKIRLEKL